MHDLITLETSFPAPLPKISSCEIKYVAELDLHVERYQESEGIPVPLVVNEILYCYKHAIFRQRFVGQAHQMRLLLETPIMQNHPHCNHIRLR